MEATKWPQPPIIVSRIGGAGTRKLSEPRSGSWNGPSSSAIACPGQSRDQPRLRLVFALLDRQRVHRMQDQQPLHRHRIVGRPPFARSERDSARPTSTLNSLNSITAASRSRAPPAADNAFTRASSSKNLGCPAIADPLIPGIGIGHSAAKSRKFSFKASDWVAAPRAGSSLVILNPLVFGFTGVTSPLLKKAVGSILRTQSTGTGECQFRPFDARPRCPRHGDRPVLCARLFAGIAACAALQQIDTKWDPGRTSRYRNPRNAG